MYGLQVELTELLKKPLPESKTSAHYDIWSVIGVPSKIENWRSVLSYSQKNDLKTNNIIKKLRISCGKMYSTIM